MRALVTGAAGFIGSHLVDRLLQDGQAVIAFDNFSSGQRRVLDNAQSNDRFELIEGDLICAGSNLCGSNLCGLANPHKLEPAQIRSNKVGVKIIQSIKISYLI